MSRARETNKIVKQLESAGAKVVPGTKHYKIFNDKKFVGVIPYTLRSEGVNPALRSCLKRELGVSV